ncbi:MAG: glycosyltransferase family 39 protein [Acidobacteria bacterium]|nr:glycosyltransferase family 39 protein [Acidobacteriota bacterium]
MLDVAGVCLLLALISALAVWWHLEHGYTLYYGDATAHLNIARRVVDSRTPGREQIGTAWLPLPHLLMLPLVGNNDWWRSGLAGAMPVAACFVLAGAFLYAAVRRAFQCRTTALAASFLFSLNPNLLYLQATPMTEPIFLAGLLTLLYATVWFGQSGSYRALLLAAAASNAASLTRYEGWFLIPFVTLYFWLADRNHRPRKALLFGLLASLAPLAWLTHNWWDYGNLLEFYNGPYSAKAIYQRALASGMASAPGDHDWFRAWRQFQAAAALCAGGALPVLGLAGIGILIWKRLFWPLVFLALPVAFYIWSIHSSGTPVFVPQMWPHSYYNTRYGLAAFPLLVFGAAALVSALPGRFRPVTAVLVAAVAISPWIAYPRPETWICWKESQVNSEARREWTGQAADYLKNHYRFGDGIYTSFGDLTGIFQQAGIPLSETLHDGNHPLWNAVEQRPDLFLWEHWAVAISGDSVATTLLKAQRRGPRFICVKMIAVKGAPVIEIYRRQDFDENSLHQSARREK